MHLRNTDSFPQYRTESRFPLDITKKPRVGLLVLGALFVLVSIYLLFAYFRIDVSDEHFPQGGWFIGVIFGILGVILTLTSLSQSLKHIHHITIRDSGISVVWSEVEDILASRTLKQLSVNWCEFNAVAWYETERYSILRQMLMLEFARENEMGKHYIEIELECDRNPLTGKILQSLLPPTAATPTWMNDFLAKQTQLDSRLK